LENCHPSHFIIHLAHRVFMPLSLVFWIGSLANGLGWRMNRNISPNTKVSSALWPTGRLSARTHEHSKNPRTPGSCTALQVRATCPFAHPASPTMHLGTRITLNVDEVTVFLRYVNIIPRRTKEMSISVKIYLHTVHRSNLASLYQQVALITTALSSALSFPFIRRSPSCASRSSWVANVSGPDGPDGFNLVSAQVSLHSWNGHAPIS
jgi:hypothetical protein